jgi:hypothetical protein
MCGRRAGGLPAQAAVMQPADSRIANRQTSWPYVECYCAKLTRKEPMTPWANAHEQQQAGEREAAAGKPPERVERGMRRDDDAESCSICGEYTESLDLERIRVAETAARVAPAPVAAPDR